MLIDQRLSDQLAQSLISPILSDRFCLLRPAPLRRKARWERKPMCKTAHPNQRNVWWQSQLPASPIRRRQNRSGRCRTYPDFAKKFSIRVATGPPLHKPIISLPIRSPGFRLVACSANIPSLATTDHVIKRDDDIYVTGLPFNLWIGIDPEGIVRANARD